MCDDLSRDIFQSSSLFNTLFFLVFNHLASIHYNGSFEIIRLGDLTSQLDNLVDGGFITYYWFGGGVGDGPCLGIYSASRSSCKSKIGD